MTGAGTFTNISRVVVVRHLGGLLRAVGPMVFLFNLSSLGPWESELLSRRAPITVNYHLARECQNGDSTKKQILPISVGGELQRLYFRNTVRMLYFRDKVHAVTVGGSRV